MISKAGTTGSPPAAGTARPVPGPGRWRRRRPARRAPRARARRDARRARPCAGRGRPPDHRRAAGRRWRRPRAAVAAAPADPNAEPSAIDLLGRRRGRAGRPAARIGAGHRRDPGAGRAGGGRGGELVGPVGRQHEHRRPGCGAGQERQCPLVCHDPRRSARGAAGRCGGAAAGPVAHRSAAAPIASTVPAPSRRSSPPTPAGSPSGRSEQQRRADPFGGCSRGGLTGLVVGRGQDGHRGRRVQRRAGGDGEGGGIVGAEHGGRRRRRHDLGGHRRGRRRCLRGGRRWKRSCARPGEDPGRQHDGQQPPEPSPRAAPAHSTQP